ncbi:hypothetical protein BGZ58_009220 [Dissophora ornata]|nr:hypothetical protein BGZ58_009220 [Dissophora ornata]
MFHSQAGTSNVDSSSLLRSFVDSQLSVQSLDGSLITMQSPNNDHDHNGRLSSNTSHRWPVLRKRLHHLYLKGHFDLQSIAMCSGPFPTYVSFSIPTLTRLDIRPSVSSAVDIHLILDSATRLEHLVIHSHGSFVNSQHAEQTEGSATTATAHYAGATHYFLLYLTIQHLKIGREELEGVAARCPNLIEFQSVCSPGALWKARPQQQQQSNQVAEHQSAALTEPRSLARTLAESCSSVERFHIGLQQGGFHLDSIRETLTSFPRLQSLGLPAWDCTKVTMDAIKTIQLDSALTKMSLTSLCIMNVCSSEKVSQAIHDYLCWTPYLKEFYAYNTTLYVDQMQQTRDIAVRENHAPLRTRLPNFTKDHQNIPETGLPPMSGESHTPTDDPPSVSVTPLTRQWACTHLERLVVRFAHLPWRNLADPPKRSKDTFAFLRSLQNLKHLCIKEGLVLEAGREYDVLEDLKGLEEVVFTTCYPIPIKPVDMMWTIRGCDTNHGQGDAVDTAVEKGNLKKVVVRRQKVNAALDKEMNDWFREHRPDLKFSFERTDCCEEEYSFHQ